MTRSTATSPRRQPRRLFRDRREAGVVLPELQRAYCGRSDVVALGEAVRLARAIGVIYLPATERQSHYYHVRPADQDDAMIHIEHTQAVQPLEPTGVWIDSETPETYRAGCSRR